MVNVIRNEDGTYTVKYAGMDVGYISKVSRYKSQERLFRGVSVLGHIIYGRSLQSVKNELVAHIH
jgi:hypothetical protein